MTVIDTVANLSEYWQLLFPGAVSPTPREWAQWLLEHDESVIRKAMLKLSARYNPKQADHIQNLPNFVRGTVVRFEKEAAEAKKAAAPVETEGDADESRFNR
jgi:hypothetical protein